MYFLLQAKLFLYKRCLVQAPTTLKWMFALFIFSVNVFLNASEIVHVPTLSRASAHNS